jgi:hypothetical protein
MTLDNWITIKTFTLPTEVVVLRGRLESEGIECFVQNELITQINPLYSNAIGGVQLQVKESDLQNAIAILKEGGYLTDEEAQPPKFLLKLDSTSSKIPFLNRLPLLFRLMILVSFFVGLTVSLFIYAILPTTYERLTENNWCLNYVTYNNKDLIPQTEEFIKLSGPGFCDETITFRQNGTVTMPGFKSPMVLGHWKLDKDSLQILQADTFDFVYNGIYQIDLSNSKLVLKSAKTTLNCHVENLHVNLPF